MPTSAITLLFTWKGYTEGFIFNNWPYIICLDNIHNLEWAFANLSTQKSWHYQGNVFCKDCLAGRLLLGQVFTFYDIYINMFHFLQRNVNSICTFAVQYFKKVINALLRNKKLLRVAIMHWSVILERILSNWTVI